MRLSLPAGISERKERSNKSASGDLIRNVQLSAAEIHLAARSTRFIRLRSILPGNPQSYFREDIIKKAKEHESPFPEWRSSNETRCTRYRVRKKHSSQLRVLRRLVIFPRRGSCGYFLRQVSFVLLFALTLLELERTTTGAPKFLTANINRR